MKRKAHREDTGKRTAQFRSRVSEKAQRRIKVERLPTSDVTYLPGDAEMIEYEDDKGQWHSETVSGRDRPHAVVKDTIIECRHVTAASPNRGSPSEYSF
jgi:hypothetical protein